MSRVSAAGILALLTVLCSPGKAICETSLGSVEATLDSLALERLTLEKRVEAISSQMDSLRKVLEEAARAEQWSSERTYLVADTRLYASPSATAQTIRFMKRGDEVTVLSDLGTMVHVATGDTSGYVSGALIGTMERLGKIQRSSEKLKGAEMERRRRTAIATQLAIGMDQQAVARLLGRATRINRTTTQYGVSEQWVYPEAYVYFENGLVTSWQDWR